MNPACACHGVPMLADRSARSKSDWRCRVSHREGTYSQRRARRARVDAIKIATGCTDCGYNAHPAALAFDHKDPSTKSASVSRLLNGASWTRVLAEIDKCEVRCHNCHAIKTQGQARAAAQRQATGAAAVAAL